MKKILLLMIIPMILGACNKEDNNSVDVKPEEKISNDPYYKFLTDRIIDVNGLKITDRKNIILFGLKKYDTHMFACGMKGRDMLIAKFNLDGSEIFSSILKNSLSEQRYAFSNMASFVYMDEDVMFIRGWLSKDSLINIENIANIANEKTSSFIAAINPKNGENFRKIIEVETPHCFFEINRFPDGYMLGSFIDGTQGASIPEELSNKIPRMIKLDQSLNVLWSRQFTENEHTGWWVGYNPKDMLSVYNGYVPLSGDRIAFITSPYDVNIKGYGAFFTGISDDYCKIIDIKKPSLIVGFNSKNAPLFDGDDVEIYAYLQNMEVSGDIIRINYRKYINKNEKDPVTGISKSKQIAIEKCHYDISLKNYSIIEHKTIPIKSN